MSATASRSVRAAAGDGLKLVPLVLLVLLPKCPACLGAYVGLFAAFGVQLLPPGIIWPATVLALVAALGFMLSRARRMRSFGPFALAAAAATMVGVTRAVTDDPIPAYAGMALFAAAVVWHRFPKALRGAH